MPPRYTRLADNGVVQFAAGGHPDQIFMARGCSGFSVHAAVQGGHRDSVSSTSPYTGVNAVAPKPIALTVNSSPKSTVGTALALIYALSSPVCDGGPPALPVVAFVYLFRRDQVGPNLV